MIYICYFLINYKYKPIRSSDLTLKTITFMNTYMHICNFFKNMVFLIYVSSVFIVCTTDSY